MALTLRPYQVNITNLCRERMKKGIRRILVQSPTGSGKTSLTANMLGTAASRGMRSQFIVHRRELVKQSAMAFYHADVPHGIIANGFPHDPRPPVQICSIGTLARRFHKLPQPNLVIWDECIAGDSIIETDVGAIKIKDVMHLDAKKVKSYNGDEIVWRDIQAWRLTGKKKTFKITLKNKSSLVGTDNHPIFTEKGWKTIGEIQIGDKVLCSVPEKKGSYLGRFWETAVLAFQISAVKIQDLRGIIQRNRLTGLFTKRTNLKFSTRLLGLLITKVMEINSVWFQHHAYHVLRVSIAWCAEMVKKQSLGIGLNPLALMDWRGGSAMMANFLGTNMVLNQLEFTHRDSHQAKTRSSGAGSSNLADQLYIPIKAINIYLSEQRLLKTLFLKLKNTSLNQCNTSWVPVIDKCSYAETDVYDISVSDTHCFFANGILVHNCHHIAAKSWENIFNAYPNAFHIGLTATPERLDGKGLRKYFDEMIEGPTVEWLIENEFLAPYKLYAPGNVSMDGVGKQMGDYKRSDLISVVDKPRITGDAIREYRKVADGKRAVVFCVSVKHSQHVVDSFNAAGIPAVHLDGESHTAYRDDCLKRFQSGEIKILSNVDLFSEGFDVPALEVVIMLRPTQSLGMYLQQVGRALRPSPGKSEAIILDHVGNYERHGLPDQVRQWSLDGKAGRLGGNKAEGPAVKVCDNCFAAQPAYASECKYCGHGFAKAPREVEQVDGDLVEVDPDEIRKKNERKIQGRARTFAELVELGKQRGYKKPYGWAKYIFNARQAKQNKGLS
jgi:superfamily II DNA or RNA helicase